MRIFRIRKNPVLLCDPLKLLYNKTKKKYFIYLLGIVVITQQLTTAFGSKRNSHAPGTVLHENRTLNVNYFRLVVFSTQLFLGQKILRSLMKTCSERRVMKILSCLTTLAHPLLPQASIINLYPRLRDESTQR